jgi:hypothetical protein
MQADLGEAALEAVPAMPLPLVLGAWGASLAVAAVLVSRRRRRLPSVTAAPQERVPWGGRDVAAVVLIYVGVQIAFLSLVPRDAGMDLQLLAGIATNLVVTLVGAAVLRGCGASWRSLGFLPAGHDAAVALAALTLVLAPLLTLAAVLDWFVPYRHPLVEFLAGRGDAAAIGLAILAAVGAAPLAEEFFFRRVLQGWLEKRLPEAGGVAAVVGSSAAFALAHHGQGLAWVPLFLFGLVLGWMARRTGSIVPCILLHAAFNAVSVTLLITTAGSAAPAGG